MDGLTGLNLDIQDAPMRIEKPVSKVDQLKARLLPDSVMDPGFVDGLIAPVNTPRDFSNLASYAGSSIRAALIDPLKRYDMVFKKVMAGEPLSAADTLAITEVHMGFTGSSLLKRRVNPNTMYSFPAWHGGGQSFKKFDNRFFKSGEGFHAFGPGHYLSDSRGVARTYAKNTAAKFTPVNYKGKPLKYYDIADTPEDWITSYVADQGMTHKDDLRADFEALQALIDTDIKDVARGEDSMFGFGWALEPPEGMSTDEMLKELKKIVKENLDNNLANFDFPDVGSKENLYKVTVMKGKKPEEYTFVDYHTPIYKQKDAFERFKKTETWNALKEAHENEIGRAFSDDEFLDAFAGKDAKITDIIKNAESNFIDENDLIEDLRNVGIHGIQYDAGTIAGGVKPGTKNYVVFSGEDISIDEHYSGKEAIEKFLKSKKPKT